MLIGFEREEDWSDYRPEHDARFLPRAAAAPPQNSIAWWATPW